MSRGRLASDTRGGVAVEFAILAPVLLLLLMGLAELSDEAYVRAALVGAMQKAARDSTIQGGANQTSTIDDKVLASVQQVAAGASYVSSRKSYAQFSSVAPEPFTDSNKNGVRDAGECFSDVNGNGTWDADQGRTGQGGASDISVYTLTLTYPHLFPLGGWLGYGATQTITSTVILKNQPYASQNNATPPTLCT